MKRIGSLLSALFLLGFLARTSAQTAVVSSATNRPPTVVWTNVPPGWTNTIGSWTNPPPVMTNNVGSLTNVPASGASAAPFPTNSVPPAGGLTNSNPRSSKGTVAPGATGAAFPPNVQTIIQQFQQQRAELINQLDNASDKQRKKILKELETLREQLQDQMARIQQQAFQQAKQFKDQLRDYAPAHGSGGGSTKPGSGTGRPRNP